MPRRQRFRGGSAPKRITSWVNLANEAVAVASLANARREIVLLLPLADEEAVTLIRIVGAVNIRRDLDAVGETWNRVAWGIYYAPSGSAGDLNMDPLSAVDKDSEHWMHIKYHYQTNDAESVALNGSGFPAADQQVDIKVMRKVQEGDGIKIVFNSGVGFRSAATLRGLVKHT